MQHSNIFRVPPVIHTGEGAAKLTGEEALRLGAKKAMVITGSHIFSSGTIQPVLDSLTISGIKIEVFSEVTPEPTITDVNNSLTLLQTSGCDLIVGCGGGSPIDVAKAVSFMFTNPGSIKDYMGINKIKNPGLPIIAVPTTAGTGSEVSQATIITDQAYDIKMLIISPILVPQVAIVDPSLTMGMPKNITAATGMDALTHAIEAYVSRKAHTTSDMFSLNAIRLLFANLLKAWKEPDNKEARSKTLLGALYAGIAFSNSSVALVHGMSRPVGALFHVPHGVSNAALLGTVMQFSLDGNIARYADIALAMGLNTTGSIENIARQGAQKVKELIEQLEIPGLEKLGVTREKLDALAGRMANDALASGSPANNPKLANKEDIIRLYYEAL